MTDHELAKLCAAIQDGPVGGHLAEAPGLHAELMPDGGDPVLVFRASLFDWRPSSEDFARTILNWVTNAAAVMSPCTWGEGSLGNWGRAHSGFLGGALALAYQIDSLVTTLNQGHMDHETAVSRTRPLTITGHSLGGALAVLTAARLAAFDRGLVKRVVTFGAPKVGDDDFAFTYRMMGLRDVTTQYWHGGDVVPLAPLWSWGYRRPVEPTWFDGGSWRCGIGWWPWLKILLSKRLDAVSDHEIGRYVSALEPKEVHHV